VTDLLRASEAVRDALEAGRPVVALETSVLSHGLPEPHNRAAARAMTKAVRAEGAEAAWVWTADRALRVGAGEEELERVMGDAAAKVARRDLPMVLAAGRLGGTTVSATLWAAHRAGIKVVATGGIGGVHPATGDVSADLLELARTPCTVVCSGPKSIVDPAATLERLEELGVGLIGYRCDALPFFIVRQTGLPLEHRADEPDEVASAARTRGELGVESALLVCNPCPEAAALDADGVAAAVGRCLARAEEEGVAGTRVTPFLLACLARETGGRSVEANLALLEANARLAARIASR
jgi:pseudouridine-5'-phosphate glycosidase